MKTIAQSIREKMAELAALRKDLTDAVARLEAGEDEAGELVDDLTVKSEEAATELERLKRVEKAMGTRATPPAGNDPDPDADPDDGAVEIDPLTGKAKALVRIGRGADSSRPPAGELLAQMAIARGIAHYERQPLDQVVAKLYPKDKRANAIAKTATNAADTTTAGWAAELVTTEIRALMQNDLRPVSVAAGLSLQGQLLNFGGAQSIVIPSFSTRTTALGGSWVGENGVIPVKQGVISSQRLNRYKLAVITVLTRELLRASDPEALGTIRRMMVQDTANMLDTSLIDAGAAVAGVRPAGLLNGVVIGAGSALGGAAAVAADLKTLYGGLLAAGIGIKPVLLVNSATLFGLSMVSTALGDFLFRDEVAAGRLLGYPVLASPFVPANTVIMVDAAYFASAFDTPDIDVSEQATLTMANADGVAPTQAMDAAGALGVANQVLPDNGISVVGGVAGAGSAGYRAMSLFQTWTLAQRLVLPVSWGLTHAGAVQALNGITW
jgi:HK97 family phage major capsid protein